MSAENRVIIGLVGEKGSGKQTFTNFLNEVAFNRAVQQVRFSDVLFETLDAWKIPTTTANLQRLSIIMNQGFGLGVLTQAVESRIQSSTADIVVCDGVRWRSDLPMIRAFPSNKLVYVTADLLVRYHRVKGRGEKVGERDLPYRQFLEEEGAETEVVIPQIGAEADFKFNNNGSLGEFKGQIQQWYQDYLVPLF